MSGISEEEEGEQGSDLMAIKKRLDPDFLLKTDLTLISFSPEVSLFDENVFSFSNERCPGNSQNEESLKRCTSFLTEKFSF